MGVRRAVSVLNWGFVVVLWGVGLEVECFGGVCGVGLCCVVVVVVFLFFFVVVSCSGCFVRVLLDCAPTHRLGSFGLPCSLACLNRWRR